MTEIDRRELARLAGWLLAGAAFGRATPSLAAVAEVDAPGGQRLLRELLGPDLESAVVRARRLPGASTRRRGRAVFAAQRRGRIVAELTPAGFRFTVWSRRAGGVTIAGDRGAVSRVIARPRGGAGTHDPYDCAVVTGSGIVVVPSSALAQRELPARLISGARLPEVYGSFGRLLLRRLERTGVASGGRIAHR